MKDFTRKILRNGMVLTLNPNDDILENCDILIEGDTIKDIGANIAAQPGDQVIDCCDKLVMPGLINSHFHSQENLFKGYFDNLPLEIWMLFAYPPSNFGPVPHRLMYLRTMLGAIGLLKGGATSIQDDFHEMPFSTVEGESAVIQAYVDAGLRANVSMTETTRHLCDMIPYLREIMPGEVRKSLPNPRGSDAIFKTQEEIIQEWNGKEDVKIVVSPGAPQRCDTAHLQRMWKLAEKYDLPYHLHICETRVQRITGIEFYHSTIAQYADSIGILGPRTTIAHNIWLDEKDIETYARTGVNAVHNTLSNMKLGSGVMPLRKLHEAGINICLGSDGMSTNDTYNTLEVIRAAALIHKIAHPDYTKWPTSDMALAMATRNASRSLMREKEIGSLEAGKKADMLVIDLTTDVYAPSVDAKTIKNHIVYSENGSSIEKSIIKGKIVIDNHRIVSVDEKALLGELRAMMPDFWKHFANTVKTSEPLVPYLREMYWRCMNHPDPMWRFTAAKSEYM